MVLHAHLPFVRHPEHEKFLEENWLYEAITESYLPLLELLEQWQRNNLKLRLTLTLTPTLCSMLDDPLLRGRYQRHLEGLLVEHPTRECFTAQLMLALYRSGRQTEALEIYQQTRAELGLRRKPRRSSVSVSAGSGDPRRAPATRAELLESELKEIIHLPGRA